MEDKDIIIDCSKLMWSIELEQKEEEVEDCSGNLVLKSYSRKREIHNITGEIKPWSEWKETGIGIIIGKREKLTLYEKIKRYLFEGRWIDSEVKRWI